MEPWQLLCATSDLDFEISKVREMLPNTNVLHQTLVDKLLHGTPSLLHGSVFCAIIGIAEKMIT